MGQHFYMFFNTTEISGWFCMTNFKVFSDGSNLSKMLTHPLLKQSECLSDLAGIAARTINSFLFTLFSFFVCFFPLIVVLSFFVYFF